MTNTSYANKALVNVKHPGVYIVAVNEWRYLRWIDPQTKRWCKLRTGTKVLAEAKRKAVLKSRTLRRERDELLDRQLRGEAVVRHLIADAATRYYRSLAKAPKRSKHTLRNTGNPLSRFLLWCAESAPGAPLRYLDELTPLTLRAFYDWCGEQKKRDGGEYKISTVNQELKPLRRMLRLTAGVNAPHINTDVLRATIPHTATGKASVKRLYGLTTQQPLDAPDIVRVLRAALAYDARSHVESHCAADIMLTLLTGMRIDELTSRRCADVSFDAREHASIAVIGKGSEERATHMRGYSALGVELLHVLVDDRAPHEWLSESSFWQLRDAYRALPSYGAPGHWTTKRVLKRGEPCERRVLVGAASSHDVRATCLTYSLSLDGVDLTRATLRVGNTPGVAMESYVKPPKGMVYGAASLEQAMAAEDVMREVVAAARARMGRPRELDRRDGQPTHAPGLSVPAALR